MSEIGAEESSTGDVPAPSPERTSIPGPIPMPEGGEGLDLESPELLLNRELTWLAFNRRVLHEAEDERNPLLERVKFLAIANSTLDEFVMKRVGGLKQQAAAGVLKTTVDGRTPRQQIAECYAVMRGLKERSQKLLGELREALADAGIQVCPWRELSEAQKAQLRDHYLHNVFPLVTPQAMDPAHPFPFVSNLSLNLLVTLRRSVEDPESLRARVKVPVGGGIPRFLRVGDELCFVPLEEVMAANLDLLFPAMHVERVELFRVTRNANTEKDEEQADDLLALIETELRERKFAPIVRLTVAEGMTPLTRGYLAAELGLDEGEDVFEIDGMLGLADLMEVAKLDIPELKDPPHHPVDHPDFISDRNLFHVIRDKGSALVHHPYQSFATSVEHFLAEAANDPKVRAIKATIYRTAEESKIVKHLEQAARNGKQVAVVVELKARFDEEANIRWANKLEAVGIHVTYGVVGLKTHCKVILVVRQDYDGLRRYAHLGTGNYHSGTARLYSDLGLFTCDPEIGHDLTELFNYLTTGYTPARDYHKLLPAPKVLKRAMLEKIAREASHVEQGRRGLIRMKMNALEDVDVTRALYRAARAGVQVELLVRDTCRLRPGIPGISENVRVVGIVGRFLEHARIYYFHNGGDEEYYIGSADLMQRNLESRVETVVPVEDRALRDEMRFLLDTQLADERSAWDMSADGTYTKRDGGGQSCQEVFIVRAEAQLRAATRLRNRRTKSLSVRNWRS
ncbi:MAG TPA: polyphosphate kinase 1 [Sandaracinaceae bacterium LLY-WYZ-13_1]|nr:polyphosphate kinase 1 [Sandaracinaceae bacterium LLY-WYZ-13_1]